MAMEYITSNKGGRKLAFENNIYIKQKVLSNGTVWWDIMGGFCPGGFCPRGFCPGGFRPGDFVPGGFVRGDFVLGFRTLTLIPEDLSLVSMCCSCNNACGCVPKRIF